VTHNVGGLDRGLRVTAGLVLVPIGFMLLAARCLCGWIDLALGFAALITGLTGFCILYLPFGFSTARSRSPQRR
jgi:hypothetical protein